MPNYEPRRLSFDDGNTTCQEATIHWVADDDTVAICGTTFPAYGLSKWTRPVKAAENAADSCPDCLRVMAAAGLKAAP